MKASKKTPILRLLSWHKIETDLASSADLKCAPQFFFSFFFLFFLFFVCIAKKKKKKKVITNSNDLQFKLSFLCGLNSIYPLTLFASNENKTNKKITLTDLVQVNHFPCCGQTAHNEIHK